MITTYSQSAAKGAAFNLADLRDFVGKLDGADGKTVLDVRVTFRGTIKTISAEVQDEELS